MTISVTTIGNLANSAGATVAVTVGAGGVPAGALIVVGITDLSASIPAGSVADSKSNTYASAVSADNNNLTTNGSGEIFYAYNVTALVQNDTITFTKAITGSAAGITAFYATGIQTSPDPHDTAVKNSATGSSASPSVTSGTPAVAGELFVGFVANSSGKTYVQDTTHNWVAPFTAGTGGGGVSYGGGDQVNAGTGTIIFAPTFSGGGAPWAALVTGFKPTPVQSPFNQDDWPNLYPVNWSRSWELSTTRFIGKDSLVTGQQRYDRPVLLQEDWRRSWEASGVRYIGLDKLNPGKQFYDLSPIGYTWYRDWEWSSVRYIGLDVLNPGKQSLDLTPIGNTWYRSWEQSNTKYIGKDSLNPGIQVYALSPRSPYYWDIFWLQNLALNLPQTVILPPGRVWSDLPQRLTEDWRINWVQALVLNFPALIPPGSKVYDAIARAVQQQDYFTAVNLLENTLTPSDLHFKFFHTSFGRMGNLGGLS